jgi:hypothetical protein
LAGGAGFTFEGAVAAVYLIALLQEGNAPGVENSTVCRVALQQRDAGEPLDDVIVDFAGANGGLARLSLQVKRQLTISASNSNTDFREVIRDCWLTLNKPDFRKGADRFGAATGEVSPQKARGLRSICELARASSTPEEFRSRFIGSGSASQALRVIYTDVTALIKTASGSPRTAEEEHEFFAHFVLVEFDFMHAGGTTAPTQLNLLRGCLNARHQSEAPAAWSEIIRLARDGAGKAAIFTRPHLVREVGKVVRLSAGASLKSDVEAVARLTRQWLGDIEDDVGGTRIERLQATHALQTARQSYRVVQLTGLPGSGKSALLRATAQTELAAGPVLLIKSGRIDGTGWTSFAAANGLSSAPIMNLLVEIGATGSSTLFIDGIDRIEKKHQPVVTDLMTEILTRPELDNWRIVMSLRDTGLEPLRNWLGKLLAHGGVGTVEVAPLNEAEAAELAKGKPHLYPLLFGPREVKEIVRRPFFAKILNQNFAANAGDGAFLPQSEVDLIRNWWDRGGYNAQGQDTIDRQLAIVEMGRLRAQHLEQEISLTDLTPSSARQVAQFVEDGILQHVNRGHTIRFAHDIFFEWAFFNVLVSRRQAWLDEIKACGEPPAVARVVELMSQAELNDGAAWFSTLKRIDQSSIRSQWVRAWLLAPLSAANFVQFEPTFASAVDADDYKFLKKALVWFQAERTTPNPNVLGSDQWEPTERLRIADLLGWPSDFAAWQRFIEFLLDKISTIPVRLIPDVVTIFEVWQNAFRTVDNPVSDRLLEQASQWLLSMEQQGSDDDAQASSCWQGLDRHFDDLRKTLARLVIHSARRRPDLVEAYLRVLLAAEPMSGGKFKEIAGYGPILAATHPGLLVDLSLRHFIDELPEAQVARERAERSWLGQSFGHHDWESLAVERDSSNYFPASPLREPFHALFEHAPEEALRLLKTLSNHAIKAWQQLHKLSYEKRGTPLPLTLTFPWGTQEFWGRDHEYYWARGMWAPKPLSCAYLALENWAFKELARGRCVDELIRLIVEDHQCIAALCTAAAIAMASETISDSVFPLVTSQRLLMLDLWRSQQDFANKQTSLIGFHRQGDFLHAKAVQAINERPVRRFELSRLLGIFFFLGEPLIRERTEKAILGFKSNPPYSTEEARGDPQVDYYLEAAANQYAELVNIENYKPVCLKEEPDQLAIVHVSPTATSPEQQVKAQIAGRWLKQSELWMWAGKFFDDGVMGENFTPRTALELAYDLQKNPIPKDAGLTDNMTGPGALAAAAAMVLCNRDGMSAEDLAWARSTVLKSVEAPETRDHLWSSGSIIPWHPGIFAARGLAADIRAATADKTTVPLLLELVAHPLEVVSKAAVVEALRLWDVVPHLSWTALHLALTLCAVPPRPQPVSHNEPLHSPATVKREIAQALKRYGKPPEWDALPPPPPPWVRMPTTGRRARSWDDDGNVRDEDLVNPTESWGPQPIWWNSKYAGEILSHVPVGTILASPARQPFLDFLSDHLKWTAETISPHWVKPGQRDSSHNVYEWLVSFGGMLGCASASLPLADTQRLYLDTIFALPGERCWDLLSPFVDIFIRVHVFDAVTVPPHAVDLLLLCLKKMLTDRGFDETSYRAGEFYNFNLPSLIQSLMFVSVSRADGAARYVNGDWSDIGRIMPIIDKFVRAGGWSANIMGNFLTLCERANEFYPAATFADQILEVIDKPGRDFLTWNSTLLPARIAGLVQHFAARETPMPSALGQKLLRILDLLVDMGDRRSAALQQSEAFREVQTPKSNALPHH